MLLRDNNKNLKKLSQSKKAVIVFMVLWLVVSSAGILTPRPARAGIIGDAYVILEYIAGTVWRGVDYLDRQLDKIGSKAFKLALQRFLNNMAYRSAIELATARDGQKPLFVDDWGKWTTDLAWGALGDFFNDTLGEMWKKDLCEPLNPLARVKIEFQARKMFEPYKPRCDFRTIMKNVGNLKNLKLNELVQFSDYFNPTSNEIGMLMTIESVATERKQKKLEEEKWLMSLTGGFYNITSKITGKIKTPYALIDKDLNALFNVKYTPQTIYTKNMVADAIGVFANTFASKLMERLYKGINPGADKPSTYSSGGFGSNWFGGSSSGVQAAREMFADLGKTEYRFGESVEVLNNLSCGTGEQFSCSIDQPLRTALETDPPLTVRQALDQGFLHSNWSFGYRNDKTGEIANANDQMYSYRTLLILRKYRIIPVGWELATQYYYKYDNSGKSLVLEANVGDKDVISLIDEYNNPSSPYYKLVDPSWVLKAPETICRRQGVGEQVMTTVYQNIDANADGTIQPDERKETVYRRNDYCADERSCIQEKADASGCDYYGYCVEEKSIWEIHGDDCPAIYNTCRSFTARDGGDVYYLTNTLQEWGSGDCNEGNVGCREYCVGWNLSEKNWSCDISSANKIYLDRDASDHNCSEEEAGCTEFYRIGSQEDLNKVESGIFENYENYESVYRTNLKKAPDYLGCQNFTVLAKDGGNFVGESVCKQDTNSYLWREDISACVAGGAPECANYALYCGDANNNFADCKFYTPVSYQGPSVPGVAGENDLCPEECVGYKTYIEKETNFGLPQGIKNLIASTKAISCPAIHTGCEEFTNLSEGFEGERKEYYSYLRACVDRSQKSDYYSFETIEEEIGETGRYKKIDKTLNWELLKSDIGEWPCTNSRTDVNGAVECNDTNNAMQTCSTNTNSSEFSPECVKFFGVDGNSYEVKQSSLVFASDECALLRRTYDADPSRHYYRAILSQSDECSASSVGCREYRGSASNSIKEIINDDFEDGSGTNQGWDGGVYNYTSLLPGGHSIYAENAIIQKEMVDLINKKESSYKLSFWARRANDLTGSWDILRIRLGTQDFEDANQAYFDDYWKFYMFDLKDFSIADQNESSIILEIRAQGRFYIDNIVLTETQDNYYLIQDSWTTPESCDLPAEGAMLGCEHYRDAANRDAYLKSFDKLCRDELVGCEPMVDTKNSDSPANINDYSAPIEADSLVYLVYDQNKKCKQPGCGAYGMIWPSSENDTEIRHETKYMIVDPNDYGGPSDPICNDGEKWCDLFTDSDGGQNYFKDPHGFVCEYGNDADGNIGWYKRGTQENCPTSFGSDTKHCIGGRAMLDSAIGNICADSSDCANYGTKSTGGLCSNWAGWCGAEYDTCMEFQDPAQPVNCDKDSVYGEPFPSVDSQAPHCDFYYYLLNSISTCNSVDLSEGCLPFNQTQDGGDAKYFSSKHCSNFINPYQPCEFDSDCFVTGPGQCLAHHCTNIPGRECTLATQADDCRYIYADGRCGYEEPGLD